MQLPLEPWEPEETVGKIWHNLATSFAGQADYADAAVELSAISGRLAVFFRGLGGKGAAEIRGVSDEVSDHRLAFKGRLGHQAMALPQASFDGDVLRLPSRLAVFPWREANGGLYIWLTALAAHQSPLRTGEDLQSEGPSFKGSEDNPLLSDLLSILHNRQALHATLIECPGLQGLHKELSRAVLDTRDDRSLPEHEQAVEQLVRSSLGDENPLSELACRFEDVLKTGDFSEIQSPRGYRPFVPVPLWVDQRKLEFSTASEIENPEAERAKEMDKKGLFRARRRKSDQVERKDSLILHKFEAILSWAEFINLNRRVDDDDNDDAKKAADDQEEISLGQISKAPATRLKLHLDLAPEDVNRERISGKHLYPEWDCRSNQYLPDHCSVFASRAEIGKDDPCFRNNPGAMRRIRAVKKQFEALLPGRVFLPAQRDGDELDIDAAIRSQTDICANGMGSDNVWRQSIKQRRNLAVSILLDVSRSTESAAGERSVIEIEREALAAFAWGLSECGDDFAINAFSSLKRDRVYITQCKDFGEPMSRHTEARICSLNPGFYTRLGAAIRHVSVDLAKQPQKKRLLLIITDGKPNDLDHYEGRHGIEDTRMAIQEARRAGHNVYGVTIDAKGHSWLPRMFGIGNFSAISHPDKLTQALPAIYRQLVCH